MKKVLLATVVCSNLSLFFFSSLSIAGKTPVPEGSQKFSKYQIKRLGAHVSKKEKWKWRKEVKAKSIFSPFQQELLLESISTHNEERESAPKEEQEDKLKEMVRQLKENGTIIMECGPCVLENIERDLKWLAMAFTISKARKIFLSSNHFFFLSVDHTRTIAQMTASSPNLEEVTFHNVNWWALPPSQEQENLKYLALGTFMRELSKNKALKKVSFHGLLTLEQAQDFCDHFQGDLPFEVTFSTDSSHTWGEDEHAQKSQQEVTTVAQVLHRHFGDKVKLMVPFYYSKNSQGFRRIF